MGKCTLLQRWRKDSALDWSSGRQGRVAGWSASGGLGSVLIRACLDRGFAFGPTAELGRFPGSLVDAFPGMLTALELGTAGLALLLRADLVVELGAFVVRLGACSAGAVGATTFPFRPRARSKYRDVLAESAMAGTDLEVKGRLLVA